MDELSRHDYCYTLVSRFELTLRDRIMDSVFRRVSDWKAAVPTKLLQDVSEIRGNEPGCGEEFLEELQLIQLADVVVFGPNYTKAVERDVRLSKDDFLSRLGDLYDIRCRTAHVRRLTAYDLELANEISRELAAAFGDPGRAFVEFLDELDEDPARNVLRMPDAFRSAATARHVLVWQLPEPDYELDGGWVGRRHELAQLVRLLESEHRVVTVSGAGGVGKTALALRAVDQLLSGKGPELDLIIWTSAKDRVLSWSGIEDIIPTLAGYEELLSAIVRSMDIAPSTDLNQLEHDAMLVLQTAGTTLIVIDNLETIDDDRIVQFILDGPSNVRFLLTSRRGLGEVERRMTISELSEADAEHLFRVVAREKGLNALAQLDSATLAQYVRRVSCYPLAVKWVIAQVALGRDINTVVEGIDAPGSEIAKFSFDRVFEALSNDSKRLLRFLAVYGDPASRGLLRHLADLPEEGFDDAVRELLLASLIVQEQSATELGRVETSLDMLSMTKGYVLGQLNDDDDLRNRIIERIQSVRSRLEEASRVKTEENRLRYMGARTEDEKIAAVIVGQGHRAAEAGDYLQARRHFERAIEIAPNLYSLYRNWGFVEYKRRQYSDAKKLVRKALRLNPHDSVSLGLMGNISRSLSELEDAVGYYNASLKLDPDNLINLIGLAQAEVRLERFEDAIETAERAVSISMERLDDQEAVARTIASDVYRREAESTAPHDPEKAAAMLKSSLAHADLGLALATGDKMLIRARGRALRSRGALKVAGGRLADGLSDFDASIETLEPFPEWNHDRARALLNKTETLLLVGLVPEAKRLTTDALVDECAELAAGKRLLSLRRQLDQMADTPLQGYVKFVHPQGDYAFISVEEAGTDYFAHRTRFRPSVELLSQDDVGRETILWPSKARHVGDRSPVGLALFADTASAGASSARP